MSIAFTERLLYSCQTKLPDKFIKEILQQVEEGRIFHSAINDDEF